MRAHACIRMLARDLTGALISFRIEMAAEAARDGGDL